ncbi:MAG TPA: hypothetical protein VGK40_10405 [Verrucomicrobiae bacterium]
MSSSNPSPDLVGITERVTAAVRSHRIKIRVLTGVAFLFGFLAIATSILLVWSYLIFYLPKDKTLMRDAEVAAHQARTGPPGEQVSVEEAVKRIDTFLGAQMVFTHFISMATTVLAVAVGVLGVGTLILLTVVILNRRATLNQLNASLAQISDELRALNGIRSTGPPASGGGVS